MDERITLQTVDPATGQPGRTYQGHSREEAAGIARQVREAWLSWRETSFAVRAQRMRAAAAVLRRRRDEYSELMTAEMGKTLADGRVLARLDGTELSPEISRRNLPAVRKLLRLG